MAKIAEAKASRLLKTSLALIAIASSLLAYQINARPVGWQSVWALFVLASVVMLALAAIAASQIDRVGVYSWPQATDLLTHPTNPQLSALEAEERGAFLAGWSAEKKLSDLLQAWAWFSRGLAALLVAAVVAAATFGLTHVPQPANTESPSTVQSGHYHRTGEAPK